MQSMQNILNAFLSKIQNAATVMMHDFLHYILVHTPTVVCYTLKSIGNVFLNIHANFQKIIQVKSFIVCCWVQYFL